MSAIKPLGFTLLLLLAQAAQATLPAKYLYPVPSATGQCVLQCRAAEQACANPGSGAPVRPCGDELRLCVERCDHQLMNSLLVEDLQERRRAMNTSLRR